MSFQILDFNFFERWKINEEMEAIKMPTQVWERVKFCEIFFILTSQCLIGVW